MPSRSELASQIAANGSSKGQTSSAVVGQLDQDETSEQGKHYFLSATMTQCSTSIPHPELHALADHADPESTQASIAACFRQILQLIGEEPDREGLQKTPGRYAEAMLSLTRGYSQTPEEVVNNAIFHVDTDELVIVRDIDISSLCEHHILPFIGKAHIGYIPRGKVLGLSKLARIAKIYARRLQVQERLTSDISSAIQEAVEPEGVIVMLECWHTCMAMRGVQKPGSVTVTTSTTGLFKEDKTKRQEFYTLLGLKR
ncbi:GTP cyclohydrolase I [Apiospora rasikravindrae]|uniref:GTP cyclohydrolase 1 n=1 Tax=Apiospora rasikravindrae TaxID=990691 RepID=A0ABR1TYK8_9PEZI